MIGTEPFGESDKAIERSIGLASPRDRFAAFALDMMILIPVVTLLQAPIRRGLHESALLGAIDDSSGRKFLNLLIFAFSYLLYHGLSVHFYGQTFGKLFFGLRVISNQSRYGGMKALSRAAHHWIGFACLGVPFLGIFTHPLRRSAHDKMSETFVISVRSPVGFPTKQERRIVSLGVVVYLFFLVFFVHWDSNGPLLSSSERFMISERQECLDIYQNYEDDLEPIVASFLDGQVTAECLKGLAEDSLWEGKQTALSHFAISLTYEDAPQRAKAYSEGVCQDSMDHPLCPLSLWLLKNKDEQDNSFRELVDKTLIDDRSDLAKLIVSRLLWRSQDYGTMRELMTTFTAKDAYRASYVSLMFVNDLAQMKLDSAQVLYRVHDHLDQHFLVRFLSDDWEPTNLTSLEKRQVIEQLHPEYQLQQSSRGPASSQSNHQSALETLYKKLGDEL